jgi:hypothetical protein
MRGDIAGVEVSITGSVGNIITQCTASEFVIRLKCYVT